MQLPKLCPGHSQASILICVSVFMLGLVYAHYVIMYLQNCLVANMHICVTQCKYAHVCDTMCDTMCLTRACCLCGERVGGMTLLWLKHKPGLNQASSSFELEQSNALVLKTPRQAQNCMHVHTRIYLRTYRFFWDISSPPTCGPTSPVWILKLWISSPRNPRKLVLTQLNIY